MPITSSAKKAVHVSKRRALENASRKVQFKQALKQARKAKEAGVKKDVEKTLQTAQSMLDRAVKTKLLHKNTARRLLSRLSRPVKA